LLKVDEFFKTKSLLKLTANLTCARPLYLSASNLLRDKFCRRVLQTLRVIVIDYEARQAHYTTSPLQIASFTCYHNRILAVTSTIQNKANRGKP
jgi:hypothetical protein